MFQIKQPSNIIIGKKSAREFQFQENCLIITSKGTKKRGWLEYLDLGNYQLFDDVEPNPSINTAEKIIPQIKSLGDAKEIVEFTKFPPIGKRGVDGGNNDGKYTKLDIPEYIKQANQERLVIYQIETPEVINDVELIAPCLPGAQLEEVGDEEYKGFVKVKVGPITAQYKGVAKFLEVDDSNHRVVIRGEGLDTRGAGNAAASSWHAGAARPMPSADGG